MGENGCRFVITTHLPVLMACNDATISNTDEAASKLVAHKTLDHVVVARSFLSDADQDLRYLRRVRLRGLLALCYNSADFCPPLCLIYQ